MTKTIKVIIAFIAWLCFWILGQMNISYDIIINLIPTLNDAPPTIIFSIYSLWLLLLSGLVITIWIKKKNSLNFLKIKRKTWLFLYLIPTSFIIYNFIHNDSLFNINPFIWTVFIILTTFIAQDIITFGILQTYLENILNPLTAALITATIFFIGHLIFYLQFDIINIIYLQGFIIFALLRMKTKNIYYIVNILHLSFLLLPFLF